MEDALSLNDKDRRVLRELATRVRDIASMPVQAERAQLWKEFNALRPQRPMVLAFPEGGWRDLLPDSEARCEDPLARTWEMGLRRTIYRHEHIHDDCPITDHFNVGWAVNLGDYGLKETVIRTEELGAYRWDAPLKEPQGFERLRFRSITIDREETARRVEMAEDILGDILRVRIHGTLWWSCGMTWTLINLRGLEQVMLDMYENPELVHRLMSFLRDARLHELETFEREGVLSLNNGPDDYTGSGGVGATDELPADDFDRQVRMSDMWVVGESQEFVGVGPDLFYALYDHADLVKNLLELVTATYIAFMRAWQKIVPFQGHYAAHWGYLHRGCVMVRDDSAMNLSPEMFDEFVRPYDQRLLDEFGGGAIHFCGRGDHYIESMSEIAGLHAIHMSQPEYNDMEIIFTHTVDKGIKLIGLGRTAAEDALARARSLHGQVHCG